MPLETNNETSMQCYIYKSFKKTDTYLFVQQEQDFSRVPKQLLDMLGKLEFVMEVALSESRPLAQADPIQVMNLLHEQGYFLQMPPRVETMQ